MSTSERLIGRKLGQYEVRSFIAQGGMATVYLAHDEGLQREVALKVLLPQFTYDKNFVERFQREARTAARLRHPHMVQIYATGETAEGDYYIAMEYIADNRTLADEIKELAEQKKVATADYALAVCRQIADALDVAHRAGIVHRDLKPSNILLGPDGTPYLTDLGVAVVQNDPRLTRIDTLVGTPDYMSPEQARSEPLDGRSDIYALGVILYELLAGRRPFNAESAWTIIHKHLTEAPPPLVKIRQGLAAATYDIVEKCLQKSPGARFQTARELVEAIDVALAAEGAAGSVSNSGVWSWRPARTGRFATNRQAALQIPTAASPAGRRRRWVYGSSALLLLLVGLGIWQLWLRPAGISAISKPTSAITASLPAPATSTPELEPTSTLAVSTSTPFPSPTAGQARALLIEEAQITLTSPTAADTFVLGDKVTFTWSWPITVSADQEFAVYLVIDSDEQQISVGFQQIEEGDYGVEVALGDYVSKPAIYRWKVWLEDSSSGDRLRESSLGTVNVVTAKETPTATLTPTLTATATSTPPTATRIPPPTPVPPTVTPIPPTPISPTPIPPTLVTPPTVTAAPAEGPTPTPAPP